MDRTTWISPPRVPMCWLVEELLCTRRAVRSRAKLHGTNWQIMKAQPEAGLVTFSPCPAGRVGRMCLLRPMQMVDAVYRTSPATPIRPPATSHWSMDNLELSEARVRLLRFGPD